MSTPHKHAEVIKAMADGIPVQLKSHLDKEWTDWKQPYVTPFNAPSEFEWRIKPASDLVCYSNVYEQFSFSSWSSREDADNFGAADRRKGLLKLTFDGETGLLKSAEVVK